MRTNLDFSPFYRSSIGFDRIFDLLENTPASTLTTGRPITSSNWGKMRTASPWQWRVSPRTN